MNKEEMNKKFNNLSKEVQRDLYVFGMLRMALSDMSQNDNFYNFRAAHHAFLYALSKKIGFSDEDLVKLAEFAIDKYRGITSI